MARSDSKFADKAPSANAITPYDQEHLVTYLRLLDADAEGAGWKEVARIVLGVDPEGDPEHARAIWQSHLDRAKWMTAQGYKDLIRDGASR